MTGLMRRKPIKRTGRYYVYILGCKNGTYYTGYTSNLNNRIKEHNNSKCRAKYLRGKLPVELVWHKEYRYFKRALDKERALKKLTHREKQELVKKYANKTK